MRTLFLDLASQSGTAAIVDGDTVIASEDITNKLTDQELVDTFESLLHTAALTYHQLDRVANVTGPGGFTSLRIGASAVNALAQQLQLPAAGIHLSDVYAARIDEPVWFWIHSTKKAELFVRSFGSDTWPAPMHVQLDELLSALPDNSRQAGELIPEHFTALSEKGVTPVDHLLLEPESWLPTLLSDALFSSDLVLPWYGRGY